MFANDDRLDESQREDALTIVHETQRCADIVNPQRGHFYTKIKNTGLEHAVWLT